MRRPFLAALVTTGLSAPALLAAQASKDTLVKPAVIYTYPNGRVTTDSVRVLQRPYATPVGKQPFQSRPDSNTVTIIRSHGPVPDSIQVVNAILKDLHQRGIRATVSHVRVYGDSAKARATWGNMGRVYLLDMRHGFWTVRNEFRAPADDTKPVSIADVITERQADSILVRNVTRKNFGDRKNEITRVQLFGDSAAVQATMGSMAIRYKLDRKNGVWVKRDREELTVYKHGSPD